MRQKRTFMRLTTSLCLYWWEIRAREIFQLGPSLRNLVHTLANLDLIPSSQRSVCSVVSCSVCVCSNFLKPRWPVHIFVQIHCLVVHTGPPIAASFSQRPPYSCGMLFYQAETKTDNADPSSGEGQTAAEESERWGAHMKRTILEETERLRKVCTTLPSPSPEYRTSACASDRKQIGHEKDSEFIFLWTCCRFSDCGASPQRKEGDWGGSVAGHLLPRASPPRPAVPPSEIFKYVNF